MSTSKRKRRTGARTLPLQRCPHATCYVPTRCLSRLVPRVSPWRHRHVCGERCRRADVLHPGMAKALPVVNTRPCERFDGESDRAARACETTGFFVASGLRTSEPWGFWYYWNAGSPWEARCSGMELFVCRSGCWA